MKSESLFSLLPFSRHRGWMAAAVGLALSGSSAMAQVSVDAVVTPQGGSFRFDITVRNEATEEVTLVSLVDAPQSDPLIGGSLVLPTGFLGNYDSGLGIVDFLADTGIFGIGQQTSGFRFDTQSFGPGEFVNFEALGVGGTLYTGSIRFRPPVVGVPDAGSTLAQLGVVGLALAGGWRRFGTPGSSK